MNPHSLTYLEAHFYLSVVPTCPNPPCCLHADELGLDAGISFDIGLGIGITTCQPNIDPEHTGTVLCL